MANPFARQTQASPSARADQVQPFIAPSFPQPNEEVTRGRDGWAQYIQSIEDWRRDLSQRITDAFKPGGGVDTSGLQTAINNLNASLTTLTGTNSYDHATFKKQIADVQAALSALQSSVITSLPTDRYVHTQNNATTLWTINHMLRATPQITLIDNAGTEMEALVEHVDVNHAKATFVANVAGKAICKV